VTDLRMTPELISGWRSSEVTGDFVVIKTRPAMRKTEDIQN